MSQNHFYNQVPENVKAEVAFVRMVGLERIVLNNNNVPMNVLSTAGMSKAYT